MKKQFFALVALSLIASSCFAALQITKVTLNPAPVCPTSTNPNPTATVAVTVAGGTAPYTFTSNPSSTPVVTGNTATFTLPVSITPAVITVTDSSTPALTTTCSVSLAPQNFSSAIWRYVSPCVGQANGSITITVAGTTVQDFFINDVHTPATSGQFSYTFTGLAAGRYQVGATSVAAAPSCSGSENFTEVFGVTLNAFENGFITDEESFITYVYCQKCISRTLIPSGSLSSGSSCCNNSCSSSCNDSCNSSCNSCC